VNFNFCRNPNCRNFAVPFNPDRVRGSFELGSYRLEGGGRHGSQLHCVLCDRKTSIVSNAAAVLEIQRLRTANGPLRHESCPGAQCENHEFPVLIHPERYYRHGLTKAGVRR